MLFYVQTFFFTFLPRRLYGRKWSSPDRVTRFTFYTLLNDGVNGKNIYSSITAFVINCKTSFYTFDFLTLKRRKLSSHLKKKR